MKGIVKGVQSVLIALVLLCMVGTGTILWFNSREDAEDEPVAEVEIEISGESASLDDIAAFPGLIPVSSLQQNHTEDTDSRPQAVPLTSDHVHSYSPSVVRDATCTQVGQMRYQCACGDFYTESIPTLEHKPGEWTVVREATTELAGLRQQRCTRCNQVLQEESIAKLPSTTTTTSSEKTSSKKNKKDEDDENHVHSYVGEITTPATCTADGVMTYSCTCKKSYTAAIPATNHPSRQTIVTAATCTEPGTVVNSCSECNAVLSQDSTKALGHNFGRWVITTQPTKKKGGKMTRTCSRCDEKEEIDIPMTTDPSSTHQHTFTVTVNAEATCTESGEYTYTCICEETYTETVKAYGHAPGNWVTVSQPADGVDGLRQKFCRRCGIITDSESIPYVAPHEHAYTLVANKEATCTNSGYRTYMCTGCGNTYTTETDLRPHTYRNGVCIVCGAPQPPTD